MCLCHYPRGKRLIHFFSTWNLPFPSWSVWLLRLFFFYKSLTPNLNLVTHACEQSFAFEIFHDLQLVSIMPSSGKCLIFIRTCPLECREERLCPEPFWLGGILISRTRHGSLQTPGKQLYMKQLFLRMVHGKRTMIRSKSWVLSSTVSSLCMRSIGNWSRVTVDRE